MARIDKDLIDRIASKLGITVKAVYPHVQKVVRETMLENDLAALLLASRHGININKYSTPDQRSAIRDVGGKAGSHSPARNDEAVSVQPRAAARAAKKSTVKRKKSKGDSVFVVHGRDEELRKSMFSFLRSLGLNPLEWGHAVATAKGANPYIGEILDAAMAKVQAVVVLFSPDDLACLKDHFCAREERKTEGKPQGQPRPNVIFEAGLALGAHPEKTLLVQVGKLKSFSDIAGKHIVRLSNDVSKRNELANRLEKLGCSVDKNGSDWTTEGDFEPSEPTKPKKRAAKR